ncbi:methyltransferase [Desulfatiferula olefinivorans]
MTDLWDIKKLLETSGYYWKTCTLHTGVRLDVFTLIGDTPKDAAAICRDLDGDLRAVTTLLNALCAMGLLSKRGDVYANTQESLRYLSKGSSSYIGYIILHHQQLVDSWNRMGDAVLTGKPTRLRVSHAGEEERENFLMGMFNLAMGMAPALAEALDLSGCSRLLDFGGGPGTFAVHFCLANPQLRATVFDLPTTRHFAEKTIARFGLSDRIDFVEGSFLDKNQLDQYAYDAAWLSHVLHGEGPDQAEAVIAHAATALRPGGRLYIHEFILDDTLASPLQPALFSLNMLVGTEAGRAYSEGQIRDMMKRQGLTDIRRMDYTGPSGSGIVWGIRV